MRLRTNLKCCGLAGIFLLVGWSGSSQAGPPDAGQDLTPTARELSDQALRQYQNGEFDAAIESFMGAFALSNNPGLLFNVAQAYRLKGDCEHARDYYQRFLRSAPETPLKPSLERRVAEMEACLQTRGVDAGAIISTTAAPAGLAKADLVSPKPEASPTRRAAVSTLRGSAAALLASSAVFGVLSWKSYRDAQDAATMRAAWDAADRYKTDTALTWTFAATGLACAVVSYFLGRHR